MPYLAAAELTYGGPGLGGELGGVKGVVMRHVRPERGPGGLVVGVHAEADPDVFSHLGGLFFCEGLGNSEWAYQLIVWETKIRAAESSLDPAMVEEVFPLLRGKDGVYGHFDNAWRLLSVESRESIV